MLTKYRISRPLSPGLIRLASGKSMGLSEFVRLFNGPICGRAYPRGAYMRI